MARLKTTVTRSKGGTDEREVDPREMQVPDVYCIAYRLGFDTPEGKAVLECWHLCHDLLLHAQEVAED